MRKKCEEVENDTKLKNRNISMNNRVSDSAAISTDFKMGGALEVKPDYQIGWLQLEKG